LRAGFPSYTRHSFRRAARYSKRGPAQAAIHLQFAVVFLTRRTLVLIEIKDWAGQRETALVLQKFETLLSSCARFLFHLSTVPAVASIARP
jgi:hypothetical protein